MNRSTALFTLISYSLATAIAAHADGPCDYDLPTFRENVLVVVGAMGGAGGVTQKFAVDIPLYGPYDAGDATRYSELNPLTQEPCDCTGRPTTCHGACYSYTTVSISTSFSFPYPVQYTDWTGDPVTTIVTITKAHVHAYYDDLYAGYTRIGDVDFSQNCHGYSLGVGDWPDGGVYGADHILACWQIDCTESTATVAYSDVHSIKVAGQDCSYCEFTSVPTITYSIEKFRGSAQYEQNGACANPVDITRAHPGGNFVLYEGPP